MQPQHILNVESKLTPSLFHKIQVQRQAPQNRDDIKKLFVENGVQVEAFDNTIDSFAVSSMVSQFDRKQRNIIFVVPRHLLSTASI